MTNKPNSEREWYIYTLNDPRDNEVRYVGVTIDPEKRLKSHVSARNRYDTHKNKWIRVLLDAEQYPVINVIEVGMGDKWEFSEQKWIAYYRSIGARLTNSTDGGGGNLNPSDETRAKMSKAKMGRKLSPEHKQALIIANTGSKRSDESRQRIKEGAQKRGISSETREKMLETRKNNPKPRSEEVRRKVSERHKGKYVSPETRVRQSIALKGKEGPGKKKVLRVEDGVIFESVAAAGVSVSRVASNITRAIKLGIRAGGYHWNYYISDNEPEVSYADRNGKYQNQTGITLPRV